MSKSSNQGHHLACHLSCYWKAPGCSSIQKQADFSGPRLLHLLDLKETIIELRGTNFKVIPRFVSVDYHLRAFECGQPIGGSYSCPCGILSSDHSNISVALAIKPSSFIDRGNVIKNGTLWHFKQLGLLKGIKKARSLEEKQSPIGTTYQRPTKKDMLTELTDTAWYSPPSSLNFDDWLINCWCGTAARNNRMCSPSWLSWGDGQHYARTSIPWAQVKTIVLSIVNIPRVIYSHTAFW